MDLGQHSLEPVVGPLAAGEEGNDELSARGPTLGESVTAMLKPNAFERQKQYLAVVRLLEASERPIPLLLLRKVHPYFEAQYALGKT